MGIMDAIINALQTLGSNGILLVAFLIIGLVVGLKIGEALRASLIATVGFAGLNMCTGLMSSSVGAATQQMVARLGINLDIVDVGWGLIGYAWGSPVAAFAIIAIVVANFVFLFLKLTKTLMVDFWNYWSYLACAAIIYGATGSIVWSVGSAVVYALISWIWADKMAPQFQDFYGIPGCSWPTGAVIAPGMISLPVIKLCQTIPGLKDINLNPEDVQEKIGVFGEPVIVGFALGLIIGILAGYTPVGILMIGIDMATVLLLLPRMISIMMEGMIVIVEAAQEKVQKVFKGREIWIGIDASTIMGNPATMTTILIMTPLVVVLSAIPGNRMLASASLAAIPWFVIPTCQPAKENIVHMVIASIVIFAVYFLCATGLATAHTAIANVVNPGSFSGGQLCASLSEGGSPITWIFYKLLQIIGVATV